MKFFIRFCKYYADPTNGSIVVNPNYEKHVEKYTNKWFGSADEPMTICDNLKIEDGTIAFVINANTGKQMIFNSFLGEIEEVIEEE